MSVHYSKVVELAFRYMSTCGVEEFWIENFWIETKKSVAVMLFIVEPSMCLEKNPL